MFEDVYRLNNKLRVFSDAEIDAVEAALDCTLPDGYREYMMQLGDGYYCNTVAKLETPATIVSQTRQKRGFWSLIDLWLEDGVFTKAEVLECVAMVDTGGGGNLFYHPATRRFFQAGRGYDTAMLGNTLREALDKFFTRPGLDFCFFVPEATTTYINLEREHESNEELSFEELVESVEQLGLHHRVNLAETIGDGQIFFADFAGFMDIEDNTRGFDVHVHYDDTLESPDLQTLLEHLEKLGFEES